MKNENILKVIIIEDNLFYSEALKLYLKANFTNYVHEILIQTFKTSEECLDMLMNRNIKPDIIILDYFLNSNAPDAMNGLDAMIQLKSINPFVEIIFHSSQEKIEVSVASMKCGAFDYVIKNKLAFKNILVAITNCITKIKADEKKRAETKYTYMIY